MGRRIGNIADADINESSADTVFAPVAPLAASRSSRIGDRSPNERGKRRQHASRWAVSATKVNRAGFQPAELQAGLVFFVTVCSSVCWQSTKRAEWHSQLEALLSLCVATKKKVCLFRAGKAALLWNCDVPVCRSGWQSDTPGVQETRAATCEMCLSTG